MTFPQLLITSLLMVTACGGRGVVSECDNPRQAVSPLSPSSAVGRREARIGPDSVEETEVARNATVPIGFSVEDVLAAYEGTHLLPFNYADGAPATELSITIANREGPYIFEDWETYDSNDGLVFPVSLRLQTADGTFDEETEIHLRARREMNTWAAMEPKVSALRGTYAVDTPEGPKRDKGSVLMVVSLRPECGTAATFTLINASPYHDALRVIGTSEARPSSR